MRQWCPKRVVHCASCLFSLFGLVLIKKTHTHKTIVFNGKVKVQFGIYIQENGLKILCPLLLGCLIGQVIFMCEIISEALIYVAHIYYYFGFVMDVCKCFLVYVSQIL